MITAYFSVLNAKDLILYCVLRQKPILFVYNKQYYSHPQYMGLYMVDY